VEDDDERRSGTDVNELRRLWFGGQEKVWTVHDSKVLFGGMSKEGLVRSQTHMCEHCSSCGVKEENATIIITNGSSTT